jgi:cation-transporting ATPase 13A3/4/5
MDPAGPSWQPYDYTEGASAIDIGAAVTSSRQSRRDSQLSHTPYGEDGEGAMFDGPGHSAIPSSVSRMSHHERDLGGRRSSEWERRRGSQESVRATRSRRGSENSTTSNGGTEAVGADEEDVEDELSNSQSRRTRRSTVLPPRTSVLENLAHLFSRNTVDESSHRQPPLLRRSSSSSRFSRWSRHSDAGSDYALETDDEAEERWGYSSGEEDDEESMHANDDPVSQSDVEYRSYEASPNSTSLPLLSADPIFGDEARIDIDLPLDDLDPPPPGPPSRQTIYVPDEDSTFRLVGYETIIWRQSLWRLGCILTFGILGLLGHWFPKLWLRWVAKEKAFIDINHGFVVVEVSLPSLVPSPDLNGVQDDVQRYGFISLTTRQIPISHLDGLSSSPVSGFEWPPQW